MHVPLWVFAAVDTHVGAPLLSVADLNVDEGVLFVEGTAAVDVKVRILYMQAQEALSWHHEAHLWLDDDLRSWLNNYWCLGLYENLGLRLN